MLMEEGRQAGSAEHSIILPGLSRVSLSVIIWTEFPNGQRFAASLNYHLLDAQIKLFLLQQQQQSGTGQNIDPTSVIYPFPLVGLPHRSIPLRGHLSVKQQVREKLKGGLEQNQEWIPKLHFTVLV